MTVAMNVAVTGASGFVGRHVLAQLAARGIEPIMPCLPGAAIPSGAARERVVWMDILTPPPDTWELLGRPDVLIHLAWAGLPNYASAVHSEQVAGHAEFLDRLLDAGLGALTVAGTCLEYGMQSGALREDMPANPVTAYGAAKDALRRRLVGRRSSWPCRLTWARLFYIHGPGQAAGSLLPQLEAAIERGDETFDMSAGDQVRDFLPVEEAAAHLVALALNGRDNEVVNICSGRPVSVREFVERTIAEQGASIRLNLGVYRYPAWEPMAFWGDRTKLDRCLGADG